MSIGKKLRVSMIGLLILLFAVGGMLLFLVLQDDSKGIYQEEPSTDLVTKAIAAAGTGKQVEIGQKELNGFLAYLFGQEGAGQEPRDFRVNSLYVTLGEGQGTAGIYAPCRIHGLEIGFTARVNLSYHQESQVIAIQFEEMKAGRVSIPPDWALSLACGDFPQGVSVQGDQVQVDTKQIDWHLGELGNLLEIRGVCVEKGNLYLSTNGMLDALEEYLKGQMEGSQWSGMLENWGGTIKDHLSSWL